MNVIVTAYGYTSYSMIDCIMYLRVHGATVLAVNTCIIFWAHKGYTQQAIGSMCVEICSTLHALSVNREPIDQHAP